MYLDFMRWEIENTKLLFKFKLGQSKSPILSGLAKPIKFNLFAIRSRVELPPVALLKKFMCHSL